MQDQLFQLTDDAAMQRTQLRRYGLYWGVVEDNADPLAIGRVRARPVQIWPARAHGAPVTATIVRTEDLPWAHYCSPYGGIQNVGSYNVPPKGSQVILAFIQGDPSYPVYLGCVWGAPQRKRENGNSPEEVRAVADATLVHVFRTPEGHVVEIDDNAATRKHRIQTPYGLVALLDDVEHEIKLVTKDGFRVRLSDKEKRVEIVTPGGQHIILDDDGSKSLSINVSGDAQMTVGGSVKVTASGDVTVESGGSMKLSSGGPLDLVAGGPVKLNGSVVKIN